MLVVRFLTQPDQMRWVRVTLASVVDLCLRLPNWHEWMKLFEIVMNYILSPIIFSKSFPIVFNRTIGQKNLGESYNALLGLGMMMVMDVLKWDNQCPKSMQALAISMSLIIHSSS